MNKSTSEVESTWGVVGATVVGVAVAGAAGAGTIEVGATVGGKAVASEAAAATAAVGATIAVAGAVGPAVSGAVVVATCGTKGAALTTGASVGPVGMCHPDGTPTAGAAVTVAALAAGIACEATGPGCGKPRTWTICWLGILAGARDATGFGPSAAIAGLLLFIGIGTNPDSANGGTNMTPGTGRLYSICGIEGTKLLSAGGGKSSGSTAGTRGWKSGTGKSKSELESNG